MRPERGPAMKTRDIRDFERPREMRYGEAMKLPVLYDVGAGGRFAVIAHRRPFQWTTSPAHLRTQL